jgi:hypothetical protein
MRVKNVREAKLIQPFAEVLQGRNWHYPLQKPGETRAAVHGFRNWMQEKMSEQ